MNVAVMSPPVATGRRPRAPVAVLGAFLPAGAAHAGEGSALTPPVDAGVALDVVVGLLVVLVAVGTIAWLVRRYLRIQPGVSGELRVLGGLAMGPRERIVLMQVGRTQLLVGVAPGRVQTLHVLDEPLPVSEAEPVPRSFAQQLAGWMAGGGPAPRGRRDA